MSAAKTEETAQVFAPPDFTPQVYTIAAGAPFADLIARQLLAETAGDRLRLADVTLLLPNRRATRTLSEAFLRQSGGQATVLPRLVPLGDLSPDELAFQAEEPGTGAGLALDLRPAIGEVRRRFLLSHLVRRWLERTREAQQPAAAAVLALADDLARLLDELGTHQVSLRQLEALVPERFAAHWQDSVVFLDILRRTWPAILADEKLVDPAQRRNAILSATGALWQRQPPGPVIAAGSTGSIPAVARLLAVVARLPQGRVVLPGLDETLQRGEVLLKTVAADPQHPQYGLVRLLGELEIEPRAVQRWPGSPAPGPRHQLLSLAFRPPVMTDGWRQLGEVADDTQRALWRRGLAGLVWLDCPHPRGEAEVIALAMRRTLRRPGKTAALVTPDRALARRVVAELGRWGLVLNDSAGLPLARTPPMVLLSLLATAAAEGLAPVALTALLKHPLASGGLQPAAFRREARRLERLLLRGPRPAAGATGLLRALRRAVETAQPWQHDQLRRLRPWLARVLRALRPFLRLFGEDSGRLPLALLLDAHLTAAEALAKSSSASGASRLWSGDDGEAASLALAEIRAEASRLEPIPAADYPALFDALLAGRAVRPRWGSHPRLFLWGPLEARLQAPDLTILAGLNEGTWPAAVDPGPWLNRPMREALGLPSPELRVGQAAHDLWQGLGARRVLLTRAAKVEGTPTRPARWLLRLAALAKSLGIERSLRRFDAETLGLVDGLDRAPEVPPPATPPAPRPPLEARPRKLPVTAIETWMRNPYALYAKRILQLEPLSPLDEPPGAPEKGRLVHGLLESFARAFPGRIDTAAEAWLAGELERLLKNLDHRPGLALTWRPRLRRALQQFVELEAERRPQLRKLLVETKGSLVLHAPAGPFELTATADRIELRRGGGIAVVDYKTGAPPKHQDVESGLAAQLPLEAAIVRHGQFPGVEAASVVDLEVWRLAGGRDDGITSYPNQGTPDELAERALAGLAALVARFDDPSTPYLAHPRPGAVRFAEYDHLARLGEWQVKEDEP